MGKRGSMIAAIAVVVVAFLAGCGSSESTPSGLAVAGSPSASPSGVATPSSSLASPLAPSPTQSRPPTTPAPTTPAPPRATPAPPTARPTVAPRPTPVNLTAAEDLLVAALRPDAAVDCAPRRTGLPDGANVGVECRPAQLFVDRVGVYRFPDTDKMLSVYAERLQQYGIDYSTGQCFGGTGGETGWGPSNAPDDPAMPWARSGCYLDENNVANVRLTCDEHTYVGILGRNSDVRTLFNWAWESAGGNYYGYGLAPGICAEGSDGY